MILIFDTVMGLCNQILDIQCAINFCNVNNYYFTFRNCSFRNKNDLKLFFKKPFEKLFDDKLFYKYDNYININKIYDKINNKNTYNLENKRCIEMFSDENELIQFLKNMKEEFIILPQFFSICNFELQPKKYYIKIKPNKNLLSIFFNLKKNLLPEKYNYIHFRYENDFTSYFNLNYTISIDSLLNRLNFKNKNLKIYIACSNIKSLSKTLLLCNDIYSYKNIIFKDDQFEKYKMEYLNFEERAFIDFLIGIYAQEIYGHSKSSFSSLLNLFKSTHNYYDII
jgi:hypothetical protein